MASLDALAPDQRAVLDLVLHRGRSYDDIARLLAIDRAAVRARALAAFDELGPDTGIADESRALITDYLLGQLPERVAEQTRERLASSPYERAWARVLASELAPMASSPLPEIPDATRARSDARSEAGADAGTSPVAPGAQRESPRRERAARRPPRLSDRPSSRLGGAIMLIVGALIVVAVVVVLAVVLSGGSSSKSSSSLTAGPATNPTTSAGATTGATATGTGTTGAGTGTTQAQVVAQNNLNPPSAGSSTAKGVGVVVKVGRVYGIVIEAQNVAPNNHNVYAAWLYNSASDVYRLGFVSPLVGKSGRLEVGSPLPTNAGHFKQLLLSLETQSNPKTPGTIVLQGPFSGVPATG